MKRWQRFHRKEKGTVILCSGGLGADVTQHSLLAQHRPDRMRLPTWEVEKTMRALSFEEINKRPVQEHPGAREAGHAGFGPQEGPG